MDLTGNYIPVNTANPLLFKAGDFPVYSPNIFGQQDQAFADCTALDERVYMPFYENGDKITFQFIGRSDLTFVAQLHPAADCMAFKPDEFVVFYNLGTPDFIEPIPDTGYSYFAYSIDTTPLFSLDYAPCCMAEILIGSNSGGTGIEGKSMPFSLDAATSCSQYFEWTNSKNLAFGIQWFGGDFFLTQRLKAVLNRPSYKPEVSKYTDSKNNELIQAARTTKVLQMLFDYAPEYVHDFLSVALLSDTILIDGKRYESFSDDYTPEWRDNERLAQVRVTMKLYNGTLIKSNC